MYYQILIQERFNVLNVMMDMFRNLTKLVLRNLIVKLVNSLVPMMKNVVHASLIVLPVFGLKIYLIHIVKLVKINMLQMKTTFVYCPMENALKENIGMMPPRYAKTVRIIAKYVKVQLHAKNAKLVIN